MIDAEKAALAALEAATSGRYSDSCNLHMNVGQLRALKALLAEPRLPAEPSEEMKQVMRRAFEGSYLHSPFIDAIYRALSAHLTKPKTKKAWAVGCGLGFVHFDTLDEALEAAGVEVKAGRVVTIAHEEVPA